jgi:hypothetical protein
MHVAVCILVFMGLAGFEMADGGEFGVLFPLATLYLEARLNFLFPLDFC